jgi:hypothetical protein
VDVLENLLAAGIRLREAAHVVDELTGQGSPALDSRMGEVGVPLPARPRRGKAPGVAERPPDGAKAGTTISALRR